MNIDICRKCGVRYFSILREYKGKMFFQGNDFCGRKICFCYTCDEFIIKKYNDYVKDCIKNDKLTNISATELLSNNSNIHPTEECCYYIEQKISEWDTNE